MNKLIDDAGFLNEAGKKATNNFKNVVKDLLNSNEVKNLSPMELKIFGGTLIKIIGDLICDKTSKEEIKENKFSSMTNEEFDFYLKNKYGSGWQFVVLEEDELKRLPPINQKEFFLKLKEFREKVINFNKYKKRILA